MEEVYNFSEVKMKLKRESEINRKNTKDRDEELSKIEDTFKKVYKDSFKSTIVKTQRKLISKQDDINKAQKTTNYFGINTRESIVQLLRFSKQDEAKKLAKSVKMSEICYLGLEAKVFADMGNFDQIEKYLEVKKSKLPYEYIAKLCLEKKKYTLAGEFINRITDEDLKEELLRKIK